MSRNPGRMLPKRAELGFRGAQISGCLWNWSWYTVIQSHSVVPDGQNQELTVRDNETSGRVKWLIKMVFEKTEKRVIIVWK